MSFNVVSYIMGKKSSGGGGGSYDPVFANNSWDDIAKACKEGAVPDSWAVGDQKSTLINGVEFNVDIIGKNHDDYADGSGKAPLTFEIHELSTDDYTINPSSSETGGWETSKFRTETAATILDTLEFKNYVAEVTKKSYAKTPSAHTAETTDKLFLPSVVELTGATPSGAYKDGDLYAYYNDSANLIKKDTSGTARFWWTRSESPTASGFFWNISGEGSKQENSASATGRRVAVAFCF